MAENDCAIGFATIGDRMRYGTKILATSDDLEGLRKLGLSDEEIARLVAPGCSLERRVRAQSPLTLAESESVRRLERVMAHAGRVFGSPEKALHWLRRPCRALDGALPIELLASETGSQIVGQELHAIDFGMFA